LETGCRNTRVSRFKAAHKNHRLKRYYNFDPIIHVNAAAYLLILFALGIGILLEIILSLVRSAVKGT
jgi:hypothetical protein